MKADRETTRERSRLDVMNETWIQLGVRGMFHERERATTTKIHFRRLRESCGITKHRRRTRCFHAVYSQATQKVFLLSLLRIYITLWDENKLLALFVCRRESRASFVGLKSEYAPVVKNHCRWMVALCRARRVGYAANFHYMKPRIHQSAFKDFIRFFLSSR